MIRYLIAMPREAEMFKKYSNGLPKGEVDVIGIGAIAIEEGKYTEDDILINIGYAGGHKIPVGTLIEPSFAIDAKTWDAAKIDHMFPLDHRLCLTSDTFVDEPIFEGPSLYDMELFKIAGLPHKELYSIKIISDNLSEKDCEEFNSVECWKTAIGILKMCLEKGG